MGSQDHVVLVDEYGNDIFNQDGLLSTIEKVEAHRRGALHRAISVFIFNKRNEVLLQKRTADKYHSPDKWTNTCCTHPLPGESPLMAAKRRLQEEMGIITTLIEVFTFSYQADVGNDLTEYEFDHVFFGVSNHSPIPNPAEVSDWNWVAIEELVQDLIRNPMKYSPWLRQCFNEVIQYISQETK